MEVRLEKRTDYKEVEFLVREAFWNVYRPGCYEHFIIHNMRHHKTFIPNLDYIIEEDGKIIAQICYSNCSICGDNKKLSDAVTLGPLSVHPDYQRKGYATKLVEYTLELAKNMGIPYVFVVGDETLYSRFGFESASKYDIRFEDSKKDEISPFFMVKVFDEEEINDIEGRYLVSECFKVDEDALEEFDNKFTPKKKEKRDNHLEL